MNKRTAAVGFFAVVLLNASLHADDKSYPNATLLIEPNQIAQSPAGKRFIILDARTRAKYEQGHIPNARWLDHEIWAKAFDHGQDAEGWSRRIGALGIGPDATVIVYDESFMRDAARVWWILRYWGIEDVRLLNGGWVGWKAKNYPTDKADVAPAAVEFTAKPRLGRLATKEQLLQSIQSGSLQIVDARTEKEFCGLEKLNNKRAGAIPGAKQLEWIDLIDKETHRFKTAADLRKLFEAAGIELNRPTATHCQSGGRSSVMAFAMELMGANDVSNYYPSWFEWGNAEDTPVVPGRPKSSK